LTSNISSLRYIPDYQKEHESLDLPLLLVSIHAPVPNFAPKAKDPEDDEYARKNHDVEQ